MPDYFVTIDNEEVNEVANNVSLTGTVNGFQCATVIRLSSIPKDSSQAKRHKQLALIEASKQKPQKKLAAAERVSL